MKTCLITRLLKINELVTNLQMIKLGITEYIENDQNIAIIYLNKCWEMTSASNCKCAFSLITSCLFSSQVPLPSDLEVWGAGLKFVEVHQAFFKQDWLHQTKLGDSNRLTTKPLSCLFVNVVKYADRERADDSTPAWKTAQSNITPRKKTKRRVFSSPITKNVIT